MKLEYVEFDFGPFILKKILWWIGKLLPLPEWKTDYNSVFAEAEQNNKVVFALFTGSDWCQHCINLHEEVLTSPRRMR